MFDKFHICLFNFTKPPTYFAYLIRYSLSDVSSEDREDLKEERSFDNLSMVLLSSTIDGGADWILAG